MQQRSLFISRADLTHNYTHDTQRKNGSFLLKHRQAKLNHAETIPDMAHAFVGGLGPVRGWNGT